MTQTEFGELKEVIVGRELEISTRSFDTTFKIFYKNNISDYYFADFKEYSINSQLVAERNEDLDNLAKILEQNGVKVYRPEKVKDKIQIQTPNFKSIHSSASNVRDLVFTYKDLIVETPVQIRSRYFENDSMYDIFKEKMFKGYKWIKAPLPMLKDETMDLKDWDAPRDFDNISMKWDLGIDAAQYLKIGDDILCNYSTYNHYMGAKWFENIMKDYAKIWYTEAMIDNHLDGNILPLDFGVFLVNDAALHKPIKEYLPEKFHNWKFISTNGGFKYKQKDYSDYNTPFVQLCSYRGMDMNVLSISPKKILVNKDAIAVQDILYKNGFDVIPVRLRHCELFGGGIHCSTLDLVRQD